MQLVVPAVIAIGAGVHLERAGLMFIPLALLAAVLAWRCMDNLTGAKADYRSFASAARNRHTWIISFLYIGTFGSFIGYSGAFPTLLKTQFPEVATSIAFLGALVGALTRPLGGMVADRLGGARVTIASFAVLAVGAVAAIAGLREHSFPLFFCRLHGAVRRSGHRQRRDLPDDPRRVPCGRRRPGARSPSPGRRRPAASASPVPSGPTAGSSSPAGSPWPRSSSARWCPRCGCSSSPTSLMGALTYAVYARRGAALAAAAGCEVT